MNTMQSLPLLQNALTVGAILFSLGLVGILTRRNLIVMFLAAEMMLQGISVSLVAWSRYHGDWGGHVLVIFVLTVAACEAADCDSDCEVSDTWLAAEVSSSAATRTSTMVLLTVSISSLNLSPIRRKKPSLPSITMR